MNGWVKIINSFLCQINQPARECISSIFNIGKLNDLCIINFTFYNLYGDILRGKYYISIALHFPYFH